MTTVLGKIQRYRIIPLLVMDEPAVAGALASALSDGGLPIAEVAFRTPAALEALRAMAAAHPDMLVGAGTVLTRDAAASARDAGAAFVVSPGMQRAVVEFCLAHDLPVFPGVCTPTEVGAALDLGLRVLKFFPAEAIGGLPYLQAIAAPFPDVRFIPTGGITAANLPGYLASPRVVACGGSWMAPQAWIAAGEFDRIRRAVEQAVRLVPPPSMER